MPIRILTICNAEIRYLEGTALYWDRIIGINVNPIGMVGHVWSSHSSRFKALGYETPKSSGVQNARTVAKTKFSILKFSL